MTLTPEFLHYGTIALTVCINAISVGIGEGYASIGALKAINTQPSAKSDIIKIAVLGMALIETAAIMGLSIAIILLMGTQQPVGLYPSIAQLGIAFAICLPGFVIGLASGLPAHAACLAVARQPFYAQKILRFMLIAQSLIQTPIIFGFIIAMFIKGQASLITTLPEALRLVASGLCIGLGSIGPAIGMARFAKTACQAIGFNSASYPKILTFTFISEAIIETPIFFSLVISLFLITKTTAGTDPLLTGIAMMGAALCSGLSALGPGIGSGNIASAACKQIAINPEKSGSLSALSMLGQGLIDTSAIFGFLIAILLVVLR